MPARRRRRLRPPLCQDSFTGSNSPLPAGRRRPTPIDHFQFSSGVIHHFTCCVVGGAVLEILRLQTNEGRKSLRCAAARPRDNARFGAPGERARSASSPRRPLRSRGRAPTGTPPAPRGAFGGCKRGRRRRRRRHPRAQVSTREGAARTTALCGANGRQSGGSRQRERQRRRRWRAPFFIGLIQKPVESRARSRTRWPPAPPLRVSSFAAYSLTPLHTILRRKKP